MSQNKDMPLHLKVGLSQWWRAPKNLDVAVVAHVSYDGTRSGQCIMLILNPETTHSNRPHVQRWRMK